MLKDNDNHMPLKWNLARIVEIHPGSDGIVRAITLRNNKGIYKRSIVNISINRLVNKLH